MNHHLTLKFPHLLWVKACQLGPLAVNQAIVKGFFGGILNRHDIVDILKKKFSVQQRNLTNLKPTELMSVLARKLVRNDYCKVKEVVENVHEDITVLKEIAV